MSRSKTKLPKLDGRRAKSSFEVDIYKQAKASASTAVYEGETFKYTTVHRYTPDINMVTKSGSMIHIEVKGNGRSFDSVVRAKMVAVQKQYPELDIRFVFYRDGKVGHRKKDGTFTRQSDWASKHGFKYSIGSIPSEWYEE